MPHARPDPAWLLCERCGYRLDSLDPDLPCPECGTPIARSLPSRRAGSAWQRGPGFLPWLRTNWRTLCHPWTRWDELRVAPARGLLVVNCLLVGALLALGFGAPALLDGYDGEILGMPAFIVIAAPFVLFSLSKVEAVGLRVLGARNGWRMTKDVAAAVVAHASVGWLLALPVLVAEVVYFRSLDAAGAAAWTHAPLWREAAAWAAAPLAGLLGFELLAWLGWRKMKFANLPAENPEEGV